MLAIWEISDNRPFNLHPDFWWFEKSGSVSNARNFSGSPNTYFLLGLHPEKKLCLYRIPGFFSGCQPGIISGATLKNHFSGCRLKGWLYFGLTDEWKYYHFGNEQPVRSKRKYNRVFSHEISVLGHFSKSQI